MLEVEVEAEAEAEVEDKLEEKVIVAIEYIAYLT